MDQWKAAFKQIYGKTPTKSDFIAAPLSIQTELPKSLGKTKEMGQKRKQLTLKLDEFGSPLKLRRPSNGHVKDPPSPLTDCRNAIIGFPADLLKTPSPARMGKRPIICANVGQLLTPEKSVNAVSENADEKAESEKEKAKAEDGILAAENQKEVTGKKKRMPRKGKKQKVIGNFLAVNLRKRRFAPISKVRGGKWNKNWKKFAKKRF